LPDRLLIVSPPAKNILSAFRIRNPDLKTPVRSAHPSPNIETMNKANIMNVSRSIKIKNLHDTAKSLDASALYCKVSVADP
jgi:hypothetical protein